MLLTNHTLTGVALGLAIDNPGLLAPTAVASHLALDAMPHFWFKRPASAPTNFRDRKFVIVGAIDFTVSAAVAISACLIWPHRIPNIIIGVLGAQLPDLIYIPIILFGKPAVFRIPGYERLIWFTKRIQWYEKPAGLITEVIWAGLILAILSSQLP